MKVAFREEGVHWLSQGKNDENKTMRNSFHLLALLELLWQAQRTLRSRPIYKFARVLKKERKKKRKGQETLPPPFVPLTGAGLLQNASAQSGLSHSHLPLFQRLWAGRTRGSCGPQR